MKRCYFCAEEIQDEAIKCKHCGEFVKKENKSKWYFSTTSLVVAFLCVGPFALPIVFLNPKYSARKKIIITAVILLLTVALFLLSAEMLKIIWSYYKIALDALG